MRARRGLILLSFCVFVLIMLGVGPTASGTGAHGWAVYRNGYGRLVLVHIPPRTVENNSGADPGQFEVFRMLSVTPEAIASVGSRVWMVFPPTKVNDGSIRRVSGVRALPATGGGWMIDPPEILNSAPALPGEGRLRGFVSDSHDNLHALIEQESAWSLYELSGDRWRTRILPDASASAYTLLSWEDSVLVLAHDDERSISAYEFVDDDWERIDIPGIERVNDALFVLGNQRDIVLGVAGENESLDIRVLTMGSDLLVHTLSDTPKDPAAVILSESNTLLLISNAPDNRGWSQSVRLTEIDLDNGRELFDGVPSTPSFFNEFVLRMLMLLMITIGTAVTLAVIRPRVGAVFLVPDGYSIADPSRRFTAMLIDLFALSALIAPLFDVGILELVTGNVFARPGLGWLALPTLLAVGMTSSTILEATLGGTIGKRLMRIRVVRCAAGEARRATLGRLILRNSIKWFLPPIAMLTIVEPGFRHRGDIAARCIVAVKAPDPISPSEDNE